MEELKKKLSLMQQNNILLSIAFFIFIITLIVSIVLFFTIGLKAIREKEKILIEPSVSTNSSENIFYEPCQCGCPSIEPIISDQNRKLERIVNGESSRAHSWPWQMLLMIVDRNRRPISFCGATIITDWHVLTAAHCIQRYLPPSIYLFAGQHSLNFNISLTSAYSVKKIFIHEEYSSVAFNDVAILTTQNRIRFDSSVSPVCLTSANSQPLQENDELVAIGWGYITGEPQKKTYPKELQQVKLTYIPTSHPNCSEMTRKIGPIHPGEICAGKPKRNVCSGDSGGPLMRRVKLSSSDRYFWEQVGIASKTVDCGWNSTYPDIYQSIQYYQNWIKHIISYDSNRT